MSDIDIYHSKCVKIMTELKKYPNSALLSWFKCLQYSDDSDWHKFSRKILVCCSTGSWDKGIWRKEIFFLKFWTTCHLNFCSSYTCSVGRVKDTMYNLLSSQYVDRLDLERQNSISQSTISVWRDAKSKGCHQNKKIPKVKTVTELCWPPLPPPK